MSADLIGLVLRMVNDKELVIDVQYSCSEHFHVFVTFATVIINTSTKRYGAKGKRGVKSVANGVE